MTSSDLTFEQLLEAPPAAVWLALLDHEGMSRWLPVKVTEVVRRVGGGRGTVRRIRVGPLAFDEEVVYADAPVGDRPGRLVYRIIRGVPVSFHRGEVLVAPAAGGRTTLTWNIRLGSPVPFLAWSIARGLRPSMERGLWTLATIVDGV